MSKIAIIVPAYNAERYLAFTLQSIVDQTFQDWSLIVIDDGSKDTMDVIAQEWVNRDARIQFFRQENTGVAGARNRGLALSDPSSEFVAFLDADDLWHPDFLQSLIDALQVNPDALAAHAVYREINANGDFVWKSEQDEVDSRRRYGLFNGRFQRLPDDHSTDFSCVAAWSQVRTPGLVLLRRSVFDKIETFDTAVVPAEDWDLWLRLTRLSAMVFVKQPLTYYRRHDTNATLNTHRMKASTLRVRQKTYAALENTPEQRRILKSVFHGGQRYQMLLKIGVMQEHLKRGELRPALRQIGYAAKHFVRSIAPLKFG